MQDLMNFISNHSYLAAAAFAIIILVLIVEFIRASRRAAQLNSTQAVQMINHDNAVVVDIRSKEQFKSGHIIDAQSVPSSELQQQNKKFERFKTKPIILVCNAGIESQKIATHLQKEGYNAYSLAGGMRGWIDAQLPIIKE